MNKKIFLIYVLLSTLGAYIWFKIYYMAGLDTPMREFIDRVRTDKDFEFKYRIISSAVCVISALLTSTICFKLAKNRGKDPWKWAKYGFFFSVFAIIHLLFFADSENNSTNA